MTVNPPCLLAVRALLASPLGLRPAELGIAGDTSHVREGDSYHLGRPEQDPRGSYSVLESPRDRAGLSSYASALDVGYWTRGGHDLRSMSVWVVGQCRRGAPDTKDIREIIYSPDGRTVKRWDRLGKRTTGDSSHRTHTHFSFFRDATKAGRDQRPLFARYLTEIGLIEGDNMDAQDVWNWHWQGERTDAGREDERTAWTRLRQLGEGQAQIEAQLAKLAAAPAALSAADRSAIAAEVLAGLPADLADQLADRLAQRLQS